MVISNNKMKNNITPDNIVSLRNNEIFVFGSNESGIHGGGAARTAMKWGAIYGNPEGIQGKTYAIPTKSKNIERTLDIDEIKPYVDRFVTYALHNPNLIFLVTEIGCGLAGLEPKDVAPLFNDCIGIDNVYLPKRFLGVING